MPIRNMINFSGPFGGYMKIGPEKWMMPKGFNRENCEKLYNFQARSDDVYISTCARSGTTFTQEMIWLLCNNLDYEAAKQKFLGLRFPFFE